MEISKLQVTVEVSFAHELRCGYAKFDAKFYEGRKRMLIVDLWTCTVRAIQFITPRIRSSDPEHLIFFFCEGN